jgi:small subunit ribosomal protein S16
MECSMVKVRLSRTGTTKRPHYRVVAIDSRRARNGRFLEILGVYDPRAERVSIRADRVTAWVERGAQVSDTVRSLLRRQARQPQPAEEGATETPAS